MTSKMKGYLAMAMAMSMMSSDVPMTKIIEEENEAISIEKRPPKGCKEYFFNNDGYFADHILITECVFTCYAINDKNAIKKFNKWKLKRDKS